MPKRITLTTRVSALESEVAVIKKDTGDIKSMLQTLIDGKQPSNDAPKPPVVAVAQDKPVLEDYAPKKWGKVKGGYTERRKAYSYAVCAYNGVKYDKDIYDAASAEYEAEYLDFAKNGFKK